MSLRADTVLLQRPDLHLRSRGRRGEAVAVRDGRVVAIGSSAEIRELAADGVTMVDLNGRTVLPGFIDCHVHLLWYGLSPRAWTSPESRAWRRPSRGGGGGRADGRGTVGPGARMGRVTLARREPADAGRAGPDRPGHPVALARKCGHIVWVNSMALRIAGVRQETHDPPGGRIDRRGSGGAAHGDTARKRDQARDRPHRAADGRPVASVPSTPPCAWRTAMAWWGCMPWKPTRAFRPARS